VTIETLLPAASRSRVATRSGAVAYINPSPSHMEQILRRARVIGGDSVEVQVFVASSAGATVPAMVRFRGDSATLAVGPVVIRARTDSAGRLLGGVVPSQGLVIERRDAAP
jgi:hypothetical protein